VTDLSFDVGDITAAIQKNMEGFNPDIESGNVGKILEIGDGIALFQDCRMRRLMKF